MFKFSNRWRWLMSSFSIQQTEILKVATNILLIEIIRMLVKMLVMMVVEVMVVVRVVIRLLVS